MRLFSRFPPAEEDAEGQAAPPAQSSPLRRFSRTSQLAAPAPPLPLLPAQQPALAAKRAATSDRRRESRRALVPALHHHLSRPVVHQTPGYAPLLAFLLRAAGRGAMHALRQAPPPHQSVPAGCWQRAADEGLRLPSAPSAVRQGTPGLSL